MINEFIILLMVLVGGHYFLDFAGQGEFLSKVKNPITPMDGVPWIHGMFAHAMIHGAFVAFVTGYWVFGVLEVMAHFTIDTIKCKGGLSFNNDQLIHVGYKVAWWAGCVFISLSKAGYV